MERKIRVLITKLGLDIHWRGAVTVAQFLREAGMEVIYLGNQFPEQIAQAALQEDVDLVGLSTLCGNHRVLAPKVVRLLRDKGLRDVKVFLGGIIPERDIPYLLEQGIEKIYGPDTPMKTIVQEIREAARRSLVP
jgi:methylmalonyl-CoA mutase C-terminal domain/subunit